MYLIHPDLIFEINQAQLEERRQAAAKARQIKEIKGRSVTLLTPIGQTLQAISRRLPGHQPLTEPRREAECYRPLNSRQC